jgi:hypothetical protein
MSLTEFEPTIPASERPQTHAVDCAADGIGNEFDLQTQNVPVCVYEGWWQRGLRTPLVRLAKVSC